MAEGNTNDVPVFKGGDVIRLEMRVADSEGVSKAEARFRNESEGLLTGIYRSVELAGELDAVAVIELRVGEDLPPGRYVCEYVALTDGLGNQSVITNPGIEFEVEGDLEEHRGPKLLEWSFA